MFSTSIDPSSYLFRLERISILNSDFCPRGKVANERFFCHQPKKTPQKQPFFQENILEGNSNQFSKATKSVSPPTSFVHMSQLPHLFAASPGCLGRQVFHTHCHNSTAVRWNVEKPVCLALVSGFLCSRGPESVWDQLARFCIKTTVVPEPIYCHPEKECFQIDSD